MAAAIPWEKLRGFDPNSPADLVTVEATSVTGFEGASASEVAEKFGLEAEGIVKTQGRILFDIDRERLPEVLKLRTIDNAYVIVSAASNFDMSGDSDACLERLNGTIESVQWDKGLDAWNRIFNFAGSLFPTKEPDEKKAKLEEGEDKNIPSFRCTCYRSGSNHPFGSMDAARSIGGAIQDKFKWVVRMKNYDIEVVVNIDVVQVYYGITLTKESLFKRTIRHFGPTTLRATICSSLLRLAEIQPGDVVVDPMCGGGSIPLEGALGYSQGFHLGGDIHEKAFSRAGDNVEAVREERNGKCLQVDIARWDVTKIPLRDNSVDVFVTDLPFGKRSGSKADNRVLYPKTMLSMARVVRPKTGRAVLLTQDKTSMFKVMGKINPYWKTKRQLYCNIGGLAALVFVMARTEKIFEA